MSALQLPFAHLNLRCNPFGELPLDVRGSLAVVDVPDLREGDPVQLIGASGHGKTTHLLALRARHGGAVYVRLDEGDDRLRGAAPASGVFLLDEAQRLRASELQGLLGRRLALAFGTHDDLSSVVGRALRTVRVDVTVARLRAVVDRRLEWARRAPGPVPVVSDSTLASLVARHGANVRAIEGALYDAVQKMEEPGHVEV